MAQLAHKTPFPDSIRVLMNALQLFAISFGSFWGKVREPQHLPHTSKTTPSPQSRRPSVETKIVRPLSDGVDPFPNSTARTVIH